MEHKTQQNNDLAPVSKKSLNDVAQMARIERVTELLCKGYSKAKIIETLMNEWDATKTTCNNIIAEAQVYLSDHTLMDRDVVKALNYNRLDSIMDECESVKDKLKTIDLINKTCGIYEHNINVAQTSDSFKFDIDLN